MRLKDSQDFESVGKANPKHVRIAATALQLPSSPVLYVGDSGTDIQTIINDPELFGVILNAKQKTEFATTYGCRPNILFVKSF